MLNRYTLVLLVSVSCFINVVVKGSSASSTSANNQLDDEQVTDVFRLLNNLFRTEGRAPIKDRSADEWERDTRIFNYILCAYQITSDVRLTESSDDDEESSDSFSSTESGDDDEEPSGSYTTIMVLAAQGCYYSCVLLLLDKGAAPDECRDDEGKTLLDLLDPNSKYSVHYNDETFGYDAFYDSIPCPQQAHYLALIQKVLSGQYYEFEEAPYLEKFIPFAAKHNLKDILVKIKKNVPSVASQVDKVMPR
jgi:hypothetical protein